LPPALFTKQSISTPKRIGFCLTPASLVKIKGNRNE
jgi:hypothetical protein